MQKPFSAIWLTLILSLTTSASFAAKQEYKSEDIAGPFRLVETQNGLVMMSTNGRYVLKGQLYDAWKKEEIESVDQLSLNNSQIPLREMSIDFSSLNSFLTGNVMKPNVVIFVDPLCPACHQLLEQTESLNDEYSFTFVVVPALGDKSNELASKFYCATDKNERVTAFKNSSLTNLTQQVDCDKSGYTQTLMLAQIIGVNGVPMIIAPDQTIGRGVPDNLALWLKTRS